MNKDYIAHIKKDEFDRFAEPHQLEEHLTGTAQIAQKFASNFYGQDWAYLAGLWHDLGKYSQEFQEYIRNVSGYSEDATDAHIEGWAGRVDHSTAGAQWAIHRLKEVFLSQGQEGYGELFGKWIAYLISGHHAGLPDWEPADGGQSSLKFRLNNTAHLQRALRAEIPHTIKDGIVPNFPSKFSEGLELSLWIRMIFSCLVDADFLDTESYMDDESSKTRANYPSIDELRSIFYTYMEEKKAKAPKTRVNKIRNSILSECQSKARSEQGFFSLTVPTGGGKTLSSMAFALNHAKTHQLTRIIYVIPYTSILEQTANVFREIFGTENIVEQHSNLDPERESARSRLAAENWDAPIILTTSVQFFESLFAARPSKCRKLHNVVNSIVILDEAQLFPLEYLEPILESMEVLKRRFNVSFVISTATQPALKRREGFSKGLSEIVEIIEDPQILESQLDRVSIRLPPNMNSVQEWKEIAKELKSHNKVLCIVSDRKSCRELHSLMPAGTFHLSALMCGEHRSQVISEIKVLLSTDGQNENIRVISTQLVEAGVDLDFPIVYRAMAGLDSLAQAAGRCNREGLLERGQLIVFNPNKLAPVGVLRKSQQVTKMMLTENRQEILSHIRFNSFFTNLYQRVNSLDKFKIIELLSKNARKGEFPFRTVAEVFRLIDDREMKTVFVPYKVGKKYIEILSSKGPERWLMRKLQRFSVNIYVRDFERMLAQDVIREIWPGYYALVISQFYNEKTGFVVEDELLQSDCFIV